MFIIMAAPTIRAKETSLNQRIVAKEVKIAKINPFKIDIDISLKKIFFLFLSTNSLVARDLTVKVSV